MKTGMRGGQRPVRLQSSVRLVRTQSLISMLFKDLPDLYRGILGDMMCLSDVSIGGGGSPGACAEPLRAVPGAAAAPATGLMILYLADCSDSTSR